MTDHRHNLILLAERLLDILDEIRDLRHSTASPAASLETLEAKLAIGDAEAALGRAWSAVEREIAQS